MKCPVHLWTPWKRLVDIPDWTGTPVARVTAVLTGGQPALPGWSRSCMRCHTPEVTT